MEFCKGKENDIMDLDKTFFANRMVIKDVEVDVAYRLGKPGGQKPHPILVKFACMAHRNKVWYSKSKITQEKKGQI